jgi:hypothetical protein
MRRRGYRKLPTSAAFVQDAITPQPRQIFLWLERNELCANDSDPGWGCAVFDAHVGAVVSRWEAVQSTPMITLEMLGSIASAQRNMGLQAGLGLAVRRLC